MTHVGASLLAIGCEAVVKNLDPPSQESRSDFIASKLAPTGILHKQKARLDSRAFVIAANGAD
jgi:hypothetical protein